MASAASQRAMVIECDGVVFDLDGVLVDSTACVERHYREWAARHGLDEREVIRTAHGRRPAETIRLLTPHLDVDAEAARLSAGEAEDLDGVYEMPGAKRLVGSLPRGTWGIVTSGTHAVARSRLGSMGLPTPDVLVTADDVARGKPDPEGYVAAAARLRLRPEQCWVVEDAPAGIQAARAAGMRVIAVTTTHTVEDVRGADVVVSGVADIVGRDNGAEGGARLKLEL